MMTDLTKPRKFVKKPIPIEAMPFKVGTITESLRVMEWMEDNGYPYLVGDVTRPGSLKNPNNWSEEKPTKGYYIRPDGALMIRTLEGDMRVDPDDWVLKGVLGEFYPCKPDMFKTFKLIMPCDLLIIIKF